MVKALSAVLLVLLCITTSIASKMPDLTSETAEELLLFFEEDELVIATRRPTPARKAPAIATVITAKEIRNMGARNILDVFKMVPGFGVSINEVGNYMLEVRGVRTLLSEKVLMMIDGHPLNRNFVGTAFRNHFAQLPVENIKQVEIVRGPGSALYGANAFVAVINVITNNAEEINGLHLTAKGGSFDTEQYNLLGGKSVTEDLKISGSIDYYRSDGEKLRVEQDRFTGTSWTLTPGDTDALVEKTDLFLKASYKDMTYSGHYMRKRQGTYLGIAHALVDDAKLDIVNYWHELGYNRSFREDLSLNIKAFFDHYEQSGTFEIFPDGYLGLFPDGLIGGPFLKNDTYGFDIQLDYSISENNHLIFGALYEKMKQYDVKRVANYLPAPGFAVLPSVQETSPAVNWNRDVNREISALFIQDEWGIRDNLNITAGVRYDHYSDFGDTTNPRIGLVWGFLHNADLKLLYGRAFRAPNFGELYTVNNVANMGNPDLKPERIETYEASLGLRLTNSLAIDLNYFYNKIDNLIVSDSSTSPSLFRNIGKAEIDGIELVLSGQYTPDNYWNISYTYQNPKDPDTGARLPDVPLHRAAASINYGLTKYLNAHTDILWTGERSRVSGDTRDAGADYTTVDIALTFKNFYKALEIQGTIHNLFDETYEDPDSSGASQYIPGDYPREGLSAMLNVSYKFF